MFFSHFYKITLSFQNYIILNYLFYFSCSYAKFFIHKLKALDITEWRLAMSFANIIKYGRVPLFNSNFSLILFWSQKSGCTSLAHWFFYQINLFKEAIKYDSFIHNYENEIYKNSSDYFIELAAALYTNGKDTYKLVRNPYTRAVSSFFSLIAPLT